MDWGVFQGRAKTTCPRKSQSRNIRSALFFLNSRPQSEFRPGGPVEQVRCSYFKTIGGNVRDYIPQQSAMPLIVIRRRARETGDSAPDAPFFLTVALSGASNTLFLQHRIV